MILQKIRKKKRLQFHFLYCKMLNDQCFPEEYKHPTPYIFGLYQRRLLSSLKEKKYF